MERGEITLVRVTTAGQIELCEMYWREYGDWAVEEYLRLTGEVVEPDHEAFHDELPMMLADRGRLYLAELEGEPVATGAIKPLDATSGEVKRMYVLPHARGQGISRRMLTQLLGDAAEIGYPRVRLDTLSFMTAAQALYRSVGFVDAPPYPQSECARVGGGDHTVYMELTLPRSASHAKGSK